MIYVVLFQYNTPVRIKKRMLSVHFHWYWHQLALPGTDIKRSLKRNLSPLDYYNLKIEYERKRYKNKSL